jgi:hypothetical protein
LNTLVQQNGFSPASRYGTQPDARFHPTFIVHTPVEKTGLGVAGLVVLDIFSKES